VGDGRGVETVVMGGDGWGVGVVVVLGGGEVCTWRWCLR
jgi:hypothetical protein